MTATNSAPSAALDTDAIVENHGTFFVIQPMTPAARSWLAARVEGEQSWWGGGLLVEGGVVEAIMAGMRSDGLALHA